MKMVSGGRESDIPAGIINEQIFDFCLTICRLRRAQPPRQLLRHIWGSKKLYFPRPGSHSACSRRAGNLRAGKLVKTPRKPAGDIE